MNRLPPLRLSVEEAARTLSRMLGGRVVLIEPAAPARIDPQRIPLCRFGPGGDFVRDVMPEDVLGSKQ